MVERARIVLCAAEGLTAVQIAKRVGCSERTVKKWRSRYRRRGLGGLRDAPRSGRPLTHGPEGQGALDRQGVHAPRSRPSLDSGASAGPTRNSARRWARRPPRRR